MSRRRAKYGPRERGDRWDEGAIAFANRDVHTESEWRHQRAKKRTHPCDGGGNELGVGVEGVDSV